MAEERYQVKCFNVEYKCDDENCQGQVVFTNQARPGVDPKKPDMIHVCRKCGKVHFLKGNPYPRQEYERIEDLKLVK